MTEPGVSFSVHFDVSLKTARDMINLHLIVIFLHLLFISPISANGTLSVTELPYWKENRFIDCIFCIDYDNFKRISVSGCATSRPMTCKGNICFMRQHKSPQFFLYTSGCLNLTQSEFELIAHGRSDVDIQAGGKGDETLLCEVSRKTNTCLCSDQTRCNNMTLPSPFSEFHSPSLLSRLDFRELLHFRLFIPQEPVLRYTDVRQVLELLAYKYQILVQLIIHNGYEAYKTDNTSDTLHTIIFMILL
uniref:Phlebovirus glycoprotein G2 fusion domain-containing protein n=1 Tax=Heterorhabditis bacteriophora TaxID=37862 RepID=A0A1I7X6K7_HETBA